VRILWIGTKSPSPPDDGGRLVSWLTLQELHRRGHDVTLVAPAPLRRPGGESAPEELRGVCTPLLVDAALPGALRTLVRSLVLRLPLTAARHRSPAIRRRVRQLLVDAPIDVVHVEQLQALAPTVRATRPAPTPPVVLRAQNVESDLWRGAARFATGLRRQLLALEARRIARFEAKALAPLDTVLALTHDDARRLEALSGRTVVAAPPPFPPRLPQGRVALAGDPPLVVLAAGGWLPNRDGTTWLLRHLWPGVRQRLPEAILHLFGWDGRPPSGGSVVAHPPPLASADAFAPGAVLLVPLRIASGVRMKILEAWARGVPVVATEAAAAGLAVRSGEELLVADEAGTFADAVARAQDPALRGHLVDAGRAYLRRHHDPAERTDSLLRVYDDAVLRRTGTGRGRA
jgi:hypothetical protein